MKINRVELKNYRNHSSGDFSFDRGINLLLGKNGAGKSSILEAAGHALFDADLRSNASDAVSRGSKTATITVTFEGGDGNEYVVERKIGSSNSVRLYLKGEKSSRVEGKEAVLQKIKELAGIEANEKNLFQNVITASQNKIVNIFSDRPADREKTFNQIFDTAIYREIFNGFAKDAIDSYKSELTTKQGATEQLGGQIKDSGELRKILKEKQSVKQEEDGRLACQIKEIEALDADRKKQEETKNQIDSIRRDIKHKQEFSLARQQEKGKAEESLALSQQAVKIVAENEQTHAAYGDTEKKLRELAGAIEALEKKQIERDRHKENFNTLTTEAETSDASRKHFEQLLVDKRAEEEKIAAEVSALQKDLDNLKQEIETLTQTGKTRGALEEAFKKQFSIWKKHQDSIHLLTGQITDLEKNRVDTAKLSDDLRGKHLEKENLLKRREEKQQLERSISELRTRLSDLKDAADKLTGGVCPFLHDQCLNIQNGTSPAEYFSGRQTVFEEERKNLDQKLSVYKNINDLISQADGACAKIEGEIKHAAADTANLEKYKASLDTTEKDLKIAAMTIKNTVNPLSSELGQELAAGDFAAIELKLTGIITELRVQYKNQAAKASDAEQNLSKKQKDLKVVQQQIVDTEAELKRLSARKIELEKEQAILKNKIELLEADIKGLDSLRENRKELNTTLASLKPGYDLYVSNQQKAQELDGHKKHIQDLEQELKTISADMQSLSVQLEKMASEFSEDIYQKLIEGIREKITEKETLQEKIARLQTEIAIAQRELDENKQREQEHKELKAGLSLLTRKLELAEKFRTNLGGMGKFVATRLMQTIETAATENFRRITGRSDEIRWVNDEKESYSVFLANGPDIEHRKRFEMLSGGEQVSVALSLRAAMASALTRANFAIFDEPTIHLDAEKKVALAESLKEMLKNLNQAIIVTHDDTFREMAQKIICID